MLHTLFQREEIFSPLNFQSCICQFVLLTLSIKVAGGVVWYRFNNSRGTILSDVDGFFLIN